MRDTAPCTALVSMVAALMLGIMSGAFFGNHPVTYGYYGAAVGAAWFVWVPPMFWVLSADIWSDTLEKWFKYWEIM